MKRKSAKTNRAHGKAALALIAAVLLLGQPLLAQHKLKPGFNLFSKEQDVQLGKEAATQVEKQMQVIKDPDLNNFINGITKRLIAVPEADAQSFQYSFKVVNEKSINAFALPGGPAFVHTGLITAADNEAQIAGVLAHEISHVALRHGTNQVSKANLLQIPAMLGGAIAGGSILGQLAQIGIGLGANSMLLKFSRNAERDADLLGAKIMASAGYDPMEMARFFEKLEAEGGPRSAFEQFLSDHPNPGNRVKAVEEEMQTFPKKTYLTDNNQLPRMKQIIAKLPPPPAKPTSGQGEVTAPIPTPNIQLTGKMKDYQGSGYSISYPDSWQVLQDKNSSEVTVTAREGVIQSQEGGVSIGFGVMINQIQPRSGQINLDQDTDQLVRQLLQMNPGMKISQNSRRIKVAGQNALQTTLVSSSPYQGETEVDTLITIARPRGLFYLVFVAPQSRMNQVDKAFQSMLRSLRLSS
ncbi:MAG: M48 family metallopeptidase [Terriglobia bacterium]